MNRLNILPPAAFDVVHSDAGWTMWLTTAPERVRSLRGGAASELDGPLQVQPASVAAAPRAARRAPF